MKLFVTLFCVMFGGDAVAQTPRGSWAAVSALAPGTEIRVTLSGGKTVRGFLQKTDGESLLINATTSQETIARQDVKRVHSKRQGHRGRNTLIGLAAGTAGGFGVGEGLDHANQSGWFPNAGKIVFSPLGALIGTVIGVALPAGRWREVYRAP